MNIKNHIVLERYIDLLLAGEKTPQTILCKEFNREPGSISFLIKSKEAKEYVQKRVDEILADTGIDKLRVVRELQKLAFSSLDDVVSRDHDGNVYVSGEDLSCVQSIKSNDKGTSVTMYNKIAALDKLANIYRLTDEPVINNNIFIGKRLFDDENIEENSEKIDENQQKLDEIE